jgi:hypothetical protein
MKIQNCSELLEALEKGILLCEEHFKGINLDALLDSRDEAPFDDNWMKSYDSVEALWGQRNSDCVNTVAEKAYKTAARISALHEASSYISDDFRLMAQVFELNHNDEFINGLLTQYASGHIPS